jgi:hypothetical protein
MRDVYQRYSDIIHGKVLSCQPGEVLRQSINSLFLLRFQLRKVWVDGTYRGAAWTAWVKERYQIILESVARAEGQKGSPFNIVIAGRAARTSTHDRRSRIRCLEAVLLCDRIEIGGGNVSTHVESPGPKGLCRVTASVGRGTNIGLVEPMSSIKQRLRRVANHK